MLYIRAWKTGKGGKWLTIVFHITKNADYKDPLALDKFIQMQPEHEFPDPSEMLEEKIEDESIDYGGDLADLLGKPVSNEFSPNRSGYRRILFCSLKDTII